MWKRRAGRITLSGIGAAACLLTLLFLTVSGVMTAAACAPPPEGATVVVLGAALRGEQPSRMLAERLKTAAAYLRDHPESSCVVSGGQNDDEIISEAEAMKRYLVGLGIEESRIYLEDRSTNTEENLRMSRDVVEREGFRTRWSWRRRNSISCGPGSTRKKRVSRKSGRWRHGRPGICSADIGSGILRGSAVIWYSDTNIVKSTKEIAI